jgi:hypothetical protein
MGKIVKLPLISDLADSYGNLTSGALSRVSAATYVDVGGVLQDSWGDRDQKVLTTEQDPDAFNASWYTEDEVSISAYSWPILPNGVTLSNAIHFEDSNGANDVAFIKANLTAGSTYVFSAYVLMDDGSAPVPHLNNSAGDFRIHMDQTVCDVLGEVVSVGNNVYRVSAYITAPTGGNNRLNGIIQYSGQSGKHFRTSGWMLEELPSGNAISAELMPNQVDRDFSGASAWTDDGTMASYDETTDLTITANLAGDYATLPTASAPMTQNEWYLVELDVANIVGSWTLGDVDGGFTIGTISANGANQQFHFKYTDASGGGLRLTAVDNNSSGDFDNFSLKNTPELALLEPSDYVNATSVAAKPRFESNGLLLEGEATNLLEYSEDFSQFTQVDIGDVISTGEADPRGGTAAYTIKADNSENLHGLYYSVVPVLTDDTSHTLSSYVKAGGKTWVTMTIKGKSNQNGIGYFNIPTDGTGVVGTKTNLDDSGITHIGNGWYRIWITDDIGNGATNPVVYIYAAEADNDATYTGDDTTEEIYFYGIQLEESPYPTSYIPTDGTQVTRTTEAGATGVTGVSWTISSDIQTALANNGTLVVDWQPGFASADGSGTGTAIITFEPSATGFIYYDFTNTDLEITDSTNTVTVDETVAAQAYTLVGRWHKVNDDLNLSKKESGSWTHGAAGAFDDTIPHTGNVLWLQYANEYPTHYKNIYFYDEYLTDAQVEGEIWKGGAAILGGGLAGSLL